MPKYVNADKLIARMREIADGKWSKRAAPVCWSDAYEHFIDEIEKAEAEDAAPVVHARWEFLGPNWLERDCYCGTCSACHVRSKYIVNTDICPNCGARMDEKEE